jgi:DNA-binding transcriptional ArsR family regulator
MSDPLEPQRCAEQLGALADPLRLCIVRCLRDGPLNVSELTKRLNVDLAPDEEIPLVNVSHHLSVLRNASLVQRRKKGRNVVYSLSPGLLQLDDRSGCCDHLNLGCCRLEMPAPEGPAVGPDGANAKPE